jgi:hypothetical protein
MAQTAHTRGIQYAIQAARDGRFDDIAYNLEDQTAFSLQDATTLYDLLVLAPGGAGTEATYSLTSQAEVGGRTDVLTALYDRGWRPGDDWRLSYLICLSCEEEDLVVNPDSTVSAFADGYRRVVAWYASKGLLDVEDVPEVFRPLAATQDSHLRPPTS